MKRKVLRGLTLVIIVVACVYFWRYASHALAGKNLSGLFTEPVALSTLSLTVLYALLVPTTGIAWTWMLSALGQRASYARMLPMLAVTQFGKYLPGNVAQHIGRIALARTTGVGLPHALFSIAYEMLLTMIACAHVAACAIILAPPRYLASFSSMPRRGLVLATVTLVALAVLFLAPRLAGRIAAWRARARAQNDYTPPTAGLRFSISLACYMIYLSNFVLVGVGLWLVARALSLDLLATVPNAVFFMGAFAGSWVLGFVAPGAPAGLGVREAVLSAWLDGILPAERIVLLIVALRIATTVGDLLNLTWGSAVSASARHRGTLPL